MRRMLEFCVVRVRVVASLRCDSFKRRPQRRTSSSLSVEENKSTFVNNCDSSSLTKTNDASTPAAAAAAAAAGGGGEMMKVVVVGDDGVGKRSIISQFSTSEYMHGTDGDNSPSASGEYSSH